MGMDLVGRRRYFGCNNGMWRRTLDLAWTFGWQSLGTHPGEHELRSLRRQLRRGGKSEPQVRRAIARQRTKVGTYFGNDGWEVSAVDAKNLAYAIRTALAAVNDLYARTGSRIAAKSFLSREDMEQIKSFSDNTHRQFLQDFSQFCEAGRFRID